MKKLIRAILCGLLAVSGAWAFDSTAWLQKREVLTREAERLRAEYARAEARATMPAEGLTIPLELYDSGAPKTLIVAGKAQYFAENGFVWATGVTVKKLQEDGETASEIVADRCLIDRQTKSGWAEGAATVRHGKTVLKGKGVYFSSPESYVKVFEEAEIESKDLKFGGVKK